MKSNEQELIDIMFQVAFTVRGDEKLRKRGPEEFAQWLVEQLKLCGFPTEPIGLSWAVIADRKDSEE